MLGVVVYLQEKLNIHKKLLCVGGKWGKLMRYEN